MKDRITALYREAGELHKRAQSIITEFSGKATPQEKTNELDTLLDQVEEKTGEAKRLERLMEQEKLLGEPQNRLGVPGAMGADGKATDPDLATKAFRKAIVNGERSLTGAEIKALRADDDDAGGFLTAPQQMVNELVQFVDDALVIRQLATVYQMTSASSLGVPSLDSDLSDADWTTELQTGSEDTVEPFGKRELRPHPLAKRVKLSRTFMRKATQNPETILRQRLGYKFAVTQEKGFMTGNGNQRPLGLFTASTNGISTARDVTCASSTAFIADELLDMKFGLKQQYQNSAKTRWLCHRDFIKRARKLKDGNGQYLWSPGLAGGQPSTILDIPYVQSEYAPNTFTTGQYIAVLGDLSFYWIAEALNLEIQVLLELYAEANQIGYIGRVEVDAMPVLEEAFARLKLA